ncbi:MAG: hypothetical protein ACRCYX_10075 [Dermatophilaceae bacterium]
MSPQPRVLGWPVGGWEIASSRLRLFTPLKLLADALEVRIAEPGTREHVSPDDLLRDIDLVYMQKDAGPTAVDLARAAVERGLPLVYDVDDDIGCWPDMDEPEVLRLAQVVIVDSERRMRDLAPLTNRTRVIPCMIDLADDPARRPPAAAVAAPRLIVCFGNRSSLEGTREFLPAVPASWQVRMIGPAQARASFTGLDYRDFSVSRFVPDLMTGQVALLAHRPEVAAGKDENRLVMALSCGRPAFVTPTPSYLALLREIGAEQLVVTDTHDLAAALNSYQPDAFAPVVARAHEYVWSVYGPAMIGRRVLSVLHEALELR